ISLGRDIMRAAFTSRGREYSDAELMPAFVKLEHKSAEAILLAVGKGELGSEDVMAIIDPQGTVQEPVRRRAITRTDEGWFNLRRIKGFKFRLPGIGSTTRENGALLTAQAMNGVRGVRLGGNGALPGERIVGILDEDGHITIYPIHSSKLKEYEDQ